MGLWMKCPKCQTHNPLFLKACARCGAGLDNLPLEQRVYVLAPAGAAAPKKPAKSAALLKATPAPESPLPATTPEVGTTPGSAKPPKKARKKKN